MNGPNLDRWQRARGWAFAVCGVTAVVFPTCTALPDSFPLSTYPMFARPRGQPEIVQLIAVTRAGERLSVPPALLGTSEVLQAKVLLEKTARGGKKRRLRLCREVAARAAKDGEASDWVRLELVRARFDPITYFTQARRAISRKRLAHCDVQPSSTANVLRRVRGS